MSEDARFKIRFMQPEEAGRLAELINDLQTLQQMAGVTRIPQCDAIKRELMHHNAQGEMIANNRGTFIVVAVDNSNQSQARIVGYLIYTQAFSVARGAHLFLNSFFIEEPFRQHGLGTKFIEFMKLHAKVLGYCECDVGVMNYNIRGHNFYKRHGAHLVENEYQLNLSPV